MRALVLTGPGQAAVQDVAPPVADSGQVVVDVERVGVCGTDVEFFTGEMAYLSDGHAAYPMRLGHEWCGTVSAVGSGVDASWVGARVTGDTMLGCGHCARCGSGRQHLCQHRSEIGIRGGWPGALAEQLLVPLTALHMLPETIDVVAGALVEPGGNALRAVLAARLQPGDRVLIWGPGSIGLLTAAFAAAAGAEVHLVGIEEESLAFAAGLGYGHVSTPSVLPDVPFGAVIDASNGVDVPRDAFDLVEPGGRVVLIGIAGRPSNVDTRTLVLKDLTAVGVLSASPGLAGAIARYASGAVDPRPLVAATVALDEVPAVLAGERPPGASAAPKIHVDPRR